MTAELTGLPVFEEGVMKKILYLTDLYYEAKGRKYYEEDIMVTGFLKDFFDVAICNPKNAGAFEDNADLIVFRNTGAVLGFQEVYDDFRYRVKEKELLTFNEFIGKADMCGKQYLVDLYNQSFPVTPTVDSMDQIGRLPETDIYVIKPKIGADSIGLEFVAKDELLQKKTDDDSMLIQPAVDFQYEVSFYFINDKFEYALYAPDKGKRWVLERYNPTEDDILFARTFVEWNTIEHGIQRVDACRTNDGKLLLVELEDLNPYLSLQLVDDQTREIFLNDLVKAFQEMI